MRHEAAAPPSPGDGLIASELCRRIGCAKADMKALSRLWQRSSLSCQQKLCIFRTLIQSKLLYGIAACALNLSQRKQLNGFQARCLRQVLHIPPAFISRVSNVKVLSRQPLTEILVESQMKLRGRALRTPAMHSAAFVPCSDRPLVSHYIRRRGRPRIEWTVLALEEARRRNNNSIPLHELAQDPKKWQATLQNHRRLGSS